ncbi:MAG TPA: twin-arginine translocase TatA/TatE family subunit [Candidatus Acidoferrales bacterium]|nr:twin-arginine translocase TatA/TatE family subunit [Candidatus Acidoferrales bacterium]
MLEDLSIGKILLIVVVILIFFGPKKIPDLAQSLGKGIREFKKAMRDVSDEMQKPVNEEPKATAQKSIESPPQVSQTDSSSTAQPKS